MFATIVLASRYPAAATDGLTAVERARSALIARFCCRR
jgi:hypothetical protein